MARRYVRDRRGRFASVGATARGGRLATASGGKRATQTKAVAGGKPAGTVGKPKGLKPDKRLSEGTDALNVRISRGDRVAMAEARRRRGSRPLKPARKDTKDQGWDIAERRFRQGLRK